MVGNIVGNMDGDFGGTSEVLQKYFGGDLGGLIYFWQANWPISGQLTAISANEQSNIPKRIEVLSK